MSVLELETTINYQFIDDNFDECRGIVLPGGTRCFAPSQMVITNKGSKRIDEISKGDKVFSYNEVSNRREFKKVSDIYKSSPIEKRMVKITLNNGKVIQGTDDHKIYYRGGWVTLKRFVSLYNDRDLEKDTKLS